MNVIKVFLLLPYGTNERTQKNTPTIVDGREHWNSAFKSDNGKQKEQQRNTSHWIRSHIGVPHNTAHDTAMQSAKQRSHRVSSFTSWVLAYSYIRLNCYFHCDDVNVWWRFNTSFRNLLRNICSWYVDVPSENANKL